MSASAARSVAREVVTRVREREAYAHETLDAVLRKSNLDPRDRSLATRLAYGAVSARGSLDEAIGRFTSPGSHVEPLVADALAVSAYEILFARTPARASVSQGVELVKEVSPRASGFANAVLRRLAENADSFPWGDVESDVSALAMATGHPVWLASMLIEDLGWAEAAGVMAANNAPAPLYLAHLPFSSSFDEVLAELTESGAGPVAEGPTGCIRVESAAAAVSSDALATHRVEVCDAAAQYAVSCVRAADGGSIVEIGAGRGTKTLLLAGAAASGTASANIIAVDTHEAKLKTLRKLADELGVDNVETCVADAASLDSECVPQDRSVDCVLIDAPCSGLGTLRRHPDRRWRMRMSEIEDLAALGSSLIERCSRLVRPKGFMVYSTCTIAHRENEQVISAFLSSEAGRDFEPRTLTGVLPEGWQRWVTSDGWFRSLPEDGGPDGHFVACLSRVDR